MRARKWLTEAQKEMLKEPTAEFHLFLNERGEYELVRWEQIPDLCGGQVRAFVFERRGERYVAYWHVSGEGTMLLPEECKVESAECKGESGEFGVENGKLRVPVGNRRYLRSGLSTGEVKDLLSRATLEA